MIKKLWQLTNLFYDWVMGNGPHEDEDNIPEPAPNLPFTWVPTIKKTRFHEATIRERFPDWVEHQGTGLFSSIYAGLSILTCVLLISLLVLTASGLPTKIVASEKSDQYQTVISEPDEQDAQVTKASEPDKRPLFSPEHVRPRIIGVSLVLFSAFTGVCVLYGPRRVLSHPKFGSDWGAFTNVGVHLHFSGRMLTGVALFLIGAVTLALGGLPFALGFAGSAVMALALIFHPGLHAYSKNIAVRVMSAAMAAGMIVAAFIDFAPAFAPAFTPGFALSGITVSVVSSVCVLCACCCAAAAMYGLCLVLAAPDARDSTS